MKNTHNKNRKGFTIVELVIVIAVIAILAAVMIPTFGSIIETANRSADTQLVAQINTILFVEDTLGGGVNDAVEIQKIIKENGLKLQTKTKGQYIWYDIDAKKVVLAGLDANGIVLNDADNGAVAAVAEGEIAASKGQMRAIVNSPENFINGYLFISEISTDGLAEAIYGLRNAENVAAIQEALGIISDINRTLGVKLTSFMNTAAVITKTGNVISLKEEKTAAKVAIVSSELTTITKSTIESIAEYSDIKIVDFHSSVATFDNETEVVGAIKDLAQIKFCYWEIIFHGSFVSRTHSTLSLTMYQPFAFSIKL